MKLDKLGKKKDIWVIVEMMFDHMCKQRGSGQSPRQQESGIRAGGPTKLHH